MTNERKENLKKLFQQIKGVNMTQEEKFLKDMPKLPNFFWIGVSAAIGVVVVVNLLLHLFLKPLIKLIN